MQNNVETIFKYCDVPYRKTGAVYPFSISNNQYIGLYYIYETPPA